MTESRAKYVAWSAALVLSLQILAVWVYLFYPAFPAMAAAVIPVGLLVVGIMMRSRLAWWVGAVIFGLMGLAHAIGFLVLVLDPLLSGLTGRPSLFGWDPFHSTGIGLLRLGSLILVGLYLTPSVRRHCDHRLSRTTTITAVTLVGASAAGILLVILPFGGPGVGFVDHEGGTGPPLKPLVEQPAPSRVPLARDIIPKQLTEDMREFARVPEAEPKSPTEELAERLETVSKQHQESEGLSQENKSIRVRVESSQREGPQPAVVEKLSAVTEALREEEAIDKELERLQGVWAAQSVDIAGAPEGLLSTMKDMRIAIEGSQITLTAQHVGREQVLQKTDFRLDPTRTPKEITLAATEAEDGRPAMPASPGIYEMDGNSLKLCFASFHGIEHHDPETVATERGDTWAGERPTGFDSREGILIVLVRKKLREDSPQGTFHKK